MILTAYINDKIYELDVPADMLGDEGESFYRKMDADMDKGWQMSRDFVENPDRVQRCQVAADRILTAISNDDSVMALLMAGYILTRLPGVTAVNIDTMGEMMETMFFDAASNANRQPMPEQQAREQAEQDIAPPYKVGRVWKYAIRDEMSGAWQESPALQSEEEAQAMREQAVVKRFNELRGIRISLDS